jgi:hypothetical protein
MNVPPFLHLKHETIVWANMAFSSRSTQSRRSVVLMHGRAPILLDLPHRRPGQLAQL